MAPKYRQPQSMLITGGSSGIGKAIAADAVRQGINVFVVARNQDNLNATTEELKSLNPNCLVSARSASVTDSEAIQSAVDEAETKIGPIDLLVNSAGMALPQYFEKLSIDDFSQQLEINYLGTVRTIQAILPRMRQRGGGWIANVSSIAGVKGVFGYTAYCGSKFAVLGFSEALQAELYDVGIGVSVVCPPDTRTPGLEREDVTKPIETKRLSKDSAVLDPEDVSSAMWKGLNRNKFIIVPGGETQFMYHLNRFAPSIIDRMMRKAARGD